MNTLPPWLLIVGWVGGAYLVAGYILWLAFRK